ncbi:hypothetical protein A8E68_34280 [Burkholderia cenocepacia]|uniref:Uncharacterized protein n=1 Tax=Burkholderia cenocepacia TaxID=95486 RepID=A0A1V2VTQ7_9BURK|nr:hypothetical protein A8E68_34280 [Burkholderia cenocepacia]ONU56307.1 hypothetical protein A8E67_25230 [Burkholderia cenocepacia]ONU76305.1 hypothetical protein A8E72_33890 [Burkholderia cenocepacia]ONU79527.1 hypothetical protein A8E73_22270 [Burkholderia cenocepacia]ONU89006.1 hypothetical protein A8E63_13865 [Burkholderia cenocepacia]
MCRFRELDSGLFLRFGSFDLGCGGLELKSSFPLLYLVVEFVQLDPMALAILQDTMTADTYGLSNRIGIEGLSVRYEALYGSVDCLLLLWWFGVG